MDSFKSESIVDFFETFKNEEDCLAYLAEIKWKNGFKCVKCGHAKCTIRKKNQARDCNACHHIESPTANTLFHKVKFGIRKAFIIVFEMSSNTKSISSSQIARRVGISRQAAWLFMHKVRKAMESSELHPMDGKVFVDEFVFGGREDLKQGRSQDSKKKKIVVAVQVGENRKIKRAYFKRIDDYSSKELGKIFTAHISEKARVITDKWSGYVPLKKDYNITGIKSNAPDFFEINTIIHQLKAGLRSVYSWVDERHIERYLSEFSYRLNRSIHKQTIFDNLINRMIKCKPVDYKSITLSS